MPQVTFFPLGNADCCRIDLDNGKKLLFDYANMRCVDDPSDKRIDLPSVLRTDLDAARQNYYDVVAITHLDDDHYCGASEFFYLEHDAQYQDQQRIRIKQLWVPAAIITEDGCKEEAAIIQAEARYRLKKGSGIRVFSRPERLKEWLDREGLSVAERSSLITDAGRVVPNSVTVAADGLEVFVHSPFAVRQNERDLEDRNVDSLVVQLTFVVGGRETKMILSADADSSVLTAMVKVTQWHEREERLEWDIFKLPHHCSYKSLNLAEQGEEVTTPVDEVKWLFEQQGRSAGIVVSTSKPIPSDDADKQPPHRQAAAYYRSLPDRKQFIVTMEYPKAASPEPLVIKIDGGGATIKKEIPTGVNVIVNSPAPRAGSEG